MGCYVCWPLLCCRHVTTSRQRRQRPCLRKGRSYTGHHTPSPAPTATPHIPTATPTPETTTTSVSPVSTQTRLSQAALDQRPMIVEVTAEPGSNAVLVRLSKTVYVRGDIWLDTSGGHTANADRSGSRMLMFEAGDLTGSVEVHGVAYGSGAALRDIHGSDAEISFQPIRWERCSSIRPVSAGCSQSSPDKRRRPTGEGGTDDLGLIFLEIIQGAST